MMTKEHESELLVEQEQLPSPREVETGEHTRSHCLHSAKQACCSVEGKPLVGIAAAQEKETGLHTKNKAPEQKSLSCGRFLGTFHRRGQRAIGHLWDHEGEWSSVGSWREGTPPSTTGN